MRTSHTAAHDAYFDLKHLADAVVFLERSLFCPAACVDSTGNVEQVFDAGNGVAQSGFRHAHAEHFCRAGYADAAIEHRVGNNGLDAAGGHEPHSEAGALLHNFGGQLWASP